MTGYRAREGDTADLIAWRVYGRQDAGVVEALLAANPGLADHGVEIPAGTLVAIPVAAPAVAASVRLWS
jgi:phage tail protein X